MTLLVKDANATVQPISTQPDAAGNLAPVHVASTVVAGVATPVGPVNPMPVEPVAGAAAIPGDATVVSATVVQTLFAGVIPANGFSIANNCSSAMWVSDAQPAADHVGFPIAAGGIYTTPPGYKPAGQVTIYGGTTSGNFAARRW